jgi:hypothetical protein
MQGKCRGLQGVVADTDITSQYVRLARELQQQARHSRIQQESFEKAAGKKEFDEKQKDYQVNIRRCREIERAYGGA